MWLNFVWVKLKKKKNNKTKATVPLDTPAPVAEGTPVAAAEAVTPVEVAPVTEAAPSGSYF